MSFFTGREVSGTPLETRPGTELLGQVFEDVLRTGDFGRLGAQGFGFAAFPGGGQSALIGPSAGAMGGQFSGLIDPSLIRGRGGETGETLRRAREEVQERLERTRETIGESNEENIFKRITEGVLAGASGQSRGVQDPSEILRAGIAIGSQLPQMQFGGRLRPGQTGIAGEAGPELLTATRQGTQVTPLLSEQSPRQPAFGPPQGSPLGTGGGSTPVRFPTTPPSRGRPGTVSPVPTVGPGPTQFSPFEQAALNLVEGGGLVTPEIQQLIEGATAQRGISPEVQNILSGLMGAPAVPGGAQELIGQVQGAGGLPPEVQQILQNVQGADALGPEARQILQSVQQQAGQTPGELVPAAQQLNEQLFAALRPFEERQIEQQVADVREGFSGIGNRLSTNLLGAETQLRGELAGQFQRGRAENLQNALNTLLQGQQAGAATQASLLSPILQAGQQRLGTQAGLVSPLLGAQQAQQGNLVDLANLLTGAAGQQQATQAGLVPSLLGVGQQQAGIQSELAQALLGAGQQQAGTIADFIPRLMGAQTQAQLASLAPIELIAQFFQAGAPNFQQGILGELLGAGATAAGAFA